MDFNFSCDTVFPQETLLTLRTRLMRRLGFSAQAASPPPGMAELLDDFLSEAQRLLYTGTHGALFRTKRWFTWALVDGERFYGYDDNEDVCSKTLDPESVDWVGTSDGDNLWLPMRRGIDPRAYDDSITIDRPWCYELTGGIEVWPTPDDSDMKLRVHGDFGLLPFTADTDKTTVDPDLVFLRALAMAKAHYRQADAGNLAQLEMNRIGELVALTHKGRRYIPPSLCRYLHDCGNPGVFGPWGIRYTESGDIRLVEEA